MAKLTYSEKADMAAKDSFQQRVWMGFKDHAKYWYETNPADVAGYTLELQKRKRYGKIVLNEGSSFGQQQKAVCEFLLNLYDVDPPVLDDNGELADSELGTSGYAASKTYDAFAGIQPGDETQKIQW